VADDGLHGVGHRSSFLAAAPVRPGWGGG
jgi:hypothetical protein